MSTAIKNRKSRDPIDGVLLFDKPIGFTSQQAVNKLKWLMNAEKAGHGGTLDPAATGLMVVAFGEATKFLGRQLDGDKAYIADVNFGAETDTADAEGEVIERTDLLPTRAEVEAALSQFHGPISQTPPIYSAISINGQRAYDLARRGVEVELAPRAVVIHALSLTDWQPPRCTLSVACSKGTYIRSLARDLGRTVGSLAHLSALRRTRSAGFDLRDAHTLEGLEAMTLVDRCAVLAPVERLLSDLPRIELDDTLARRFRQGQAVVVKSPHQSEAAVFDRVGLVGLGQVNEGTVKPLRLVVRAQV